VSCALAQWLQQLARGVQHAQQQQQQHAQAQLQHAGAGAGAGAASERDVAALSAQLHACLDRASSEACALTQVLLAFATQFACFTRTKVQILTQAARRANCGRV
jgi:hypothetical protein